MEAYQNQHRNKMSGVFDVLVKYDLSPQCYFCGGSRDSGYIIQVYKWCGGLIKEEMRDNVRICNECIVHCQGRNGRSYELK